MRYMILFLTIVSSTLLASHANCTFCEDSIKEKQVFYEDQDVMGLIDYKPVEDRHILIIPKRHVEDYMDLSEREVLAVHRLTRKVVKVLRKDFHKDSFVVYQKNGKSVGQSIPHVHFHIVSRDKNASWIFTLAFKATYRSVFPAISDERLFKQKRELSELVPR